MTAEEARGWAEARLDPAAMDRLDRFAAMVVAENAHQNLIAPGTIPTIWQRHIADSLQLLPLAENRRDWIDIGSGGGFPGVVLAIAGAAPMTLVEPRKRRVAFLRACVAALGLRNTSVVEAKVEVVEASAEVITARAVASVEKLLRAARHCCTPTTRWLLPRGASGTGDAERLLASMGMMFHVEQSLTEPTSTILVLDGCPR